MTESSHGLVRTIGRWSLTALMINSIIGGGIFGLPSLLAAKLGRLSPLGCLSAGAGILIIAACIAEVSSRYEQTGGLYLYARDALGRFAGLVVAWLIWLTRISAPAAVADLFCTYLAQFVPFAGTNNGKLLILGFLLAHLAFLNYIGAKAGKNLSNFFTAAKVGFLLFFVLAGLFLLLLKPEVRVPLAEPVVSAGAGLMRFSFSCTDMAVSKVHWLSVARAQIPNEILPSRCCWPSEPFRSSTPACNM